MSQVLSTLEYNELDVLSDLSAFHRVDSLEEISSVRYFQLVPRLGAYRGMVRARIEYEAIDKKEPAPARQDTALNALEGAGWIERKTEGVDA